MQEMQQGYERGDRTGEMPSGPLVSVITTTFNHERYIRNCVESVLSQTYADWEQILVDDESTDGTVDIVRKIHDDRIRVIVQPHQGIFGLAESYNRALRLAQGDLIAILEGDDFWPSEKLSTLVPAFTDPSIVLAYGLARIVKSNGALTGQTIPSRSALRKLSRSVFTNTPVGSAVPAMLLPYPGVFTYPCTVVIRRSTLESLGGFQTVGDGHAVDWATCINLALKGQFVFHPAVMGFWRRHATSANSSLRLEEFWREDYRYLTRFALRHKTTLGLSPAALQHVDRSWQQLWPRLWRIQGRHLLLDRDWKHARGNFLRALQGPDIPQGKIISIFGLIGSVVHRDIEWIWRVGNRPTFVDEI